MSTVPAYSITTDAIAAEQKRSGGNVEDIDVSKVIALDDLELPPLGPTDVRMKILAVSAEHNIDHATTADTVNIADARGGKMYPGNSATGEVVEVGENVTKFAVGDIVITHCNGGSRRVRLSAAHLGVRSAEESIGWYAEGRRRRRLAARSRRRSTRGLNLWEIAALPLRAPTAYHMWRRALGIYRI